MPSMEPSGTWQDRLLHDARTGHLDRRVQFAETLWQLLEQLPTVPVQSRYHFVHFLERLYRLLLDELRSYQQRFQLLEDDDEVQRQCRLLLQLWYRLALLQHTEQARLGLDHYSLTLCDGRLNSYTTLFLVQGLMLMLLDQMHQVYAVCLERVAHEHWPLRAGAQARSAALAQWMRAHELWPTVRADASTIATLDSEELHWTVQQCHRHLLECREGQEEKNDETELGRLQDVIYALHFAAAQYSSLLVSEHRSEGRDVLIDDDEDEDMDMDDRRDRIESPTLVLVEEDARPVPSVGGVAVNSVWVDDLAQQMTTLHRHTLVWHLFHSPALYFSRVPLHGLVYVGESGSRLGEAFPALRERAHSLPRDAARFSHHVQRYARDNIDERFKDRLRVDLVEHLLRGGERQIYVRDHSGVQVRNPRRLLEYFRGTQQIDNLLGQLSECPGLEFHEHDTPLLCQLQYVYVLDLLIRSRTGLSLTRTCLLRHPGEWLCETERWEQVLRGQRPLLMLAAGRWMLIYQCRLLVCASVQQALVLWMLLVQHVCSESSVCGVMLHDCLQYLMEHFILAPPIEELDRETTGEPVAKRARTENEQTTDIITLSF